MTEQSAKVPLMGYPMLLLAVTVGPLIVTTALVLMVDGRVPDFSRWQDVAEFTIALVGGLVVWGVGVRAYMRKGADAANRATATIANAQPAFWFLGVVLGLGCGVGIINSAMATRASLAGWYCDDITSEQGALRDRCLEVALGCDDLADEGPCGDIGSDAQAEQCVVTFKRQIESLTEQQRAMVPEPEGGDYAEAIRAICIVEQLDSQ